MTKFGLKVYVIRLKNGNYASQRGPPVRSVLLLFELHFSASFLYNSEKKKNNTSIESKDIYL